MSYVGIVIISHSSKIASGIEELIRQVITEVPIEVAGGTDENDIGTSMEKIMAAMEKADLGKGVLLFYDLGSAMMNAEMALEMVEQKGMVVEAPLVEGSYIAAVEANMGKSLEEVKETVQRAFR